MNKPLNKKDFLVFLKKYGYILILSAILLVTAVVMAIVVSLPQDNTNPVDTGTITFASPILNATVAKGYSDTALMYNSTLKQWEAHKAITFTVATDNDVFAVLDGTVKEIYSNYLEGTVVVLEHSGGLTSIYRSLNSSVPVGVGDIVLKGSVIGQASNTANAEYNLGSHLSYQLKLNGTVIDPTSYLNVENK